ncbi:hypothetical protein GIB67_012530 [Kingdonia uniflora]|uniref:Uncharacterized protein n=1 Tax=Kingdonia uniflora TaxID=39325 RepID=A0A7J7N5R4_9MAGN|nr:hypothetical protein GIB67_012530 [Kingdonia uniflora]
MLLDGSAFLCYIDERIIEIQGDGQKVLKALEAIWTPKKVPGCHNIVAYWKMSFDIFPSYDLSCLDIMLKRILSKSQERGQGSRNQGCRDNLLLSSPSRRERRYREIL